MKSLFIKKAFIVILMVSVREKYPELTPAEFITRLSREINQLLSEYSPSDASKLFSDMTRGYSKYKFGKDEHDRKRIMWDSSYYHYRELLFDEILRILFRLTQKPTGSLVPLFDLLDQVAVYDQAGQSFMRLKFMFYREFLAMLVNRIPFPIKYYPVSAVFEKDEETLQRVIALENVRAVLQGKCPHCNGNIHPRNVKRFMDNQVITCSYCDHSIRAEWPFTKTDRANSRSAPLTK